MSFLRSHKIEIGIFVVAIIVRLAYLGLSVHANNGDFIASVQGADGYFLVSQNIIAGHGFSDSTQPPYVPYSFRPPLYHYFIAWMYSIFGGFGGVILVQILIGGLIPILAMRVVRNLFSRTIEVWTGVFLALEPMSVLLSTVLYSETLFLFFFLVSFLFLFGYFKEKRVLHLLFAACFLGFATLTRPTAEYLPLLIALAMLWNARRQFSRKVVLDTALYALTFILVLSPWLYRNYVLYGEAVISPQLGVNLYANAVPSVLSLVNGTTYQEEYSILHDKGVTGPNETQVGGDKGYTQAAVPILLAHPKEFAILLGSTELAFFTHDGMFDVLRHVGNRPDVLLGKPAVALLFSDPKAFFKFILYYLTKPAVLILVMRTLWYAITALFVVGAVEYLRKEGPTPFVLVALLSIAYSALTVLALGFTINARYRLAVEFLIVPLALYGFIYCKSLWSRKTV